jgi:7-carboxy-7-deazaguanine synthase
MTRRATFADTVSTEPAVGQPSGTPKGKKPASATTASTTAQQPPATPGKTLLIPDKAIPIIEIFGPTTQGEGRYTGVPVHFVRTGGCSYRCSWCDSTFAVDPQLVRENAEKLTPGQIIHRLGRLGGDPGWVVISGGNPVLHDLGPLVEQIHRSGRNVSVETQGDIWRPWLASVELLTVSPKPPSSKMETDWTKLDNIINRKARSYGQVDLKVVAFDDLDLSYAKEVFQRYPADGDNLRHFISTGTFVGESTRDDILDRMREFIERGLRDPALARVTYGCQFHVLLYGHIRGV